MLQLDEMYNKPEFGVDNMGENDTYNNEDLNISFPKV